LFYMKTKIQIDERSSLYFDQWQYSVAIFQNRICDIRGLNVDATLKGIQYRSGSKYFGKIYSYDMIDDILKSLEFFRNEKQPHKLILSGNWAYVYTNDLDIIARIENGCPATVKFVKQAVLSQPKDVVLLTDTKFGYRTYFKSRWIEGHEIVLMNNFFAAQQDQNIKICGSFKKFLKSNVKYRSHWMADHYFVDHNDPGYPLMLNLIVPQMVRKTLPIAQRINN
jgi:hypothetical protein